MEYDAGKDFDTKASFLNYRKAYSGPLNFGFEIGVQGWGDAILQKDDVQRACDLVKTKQNDGIFIWAYYSKSGPGISVGDCIDLSASNLYKPVSPVVTPQKKLIWSCPSSVSIKCPKCENLITTSWKQG